MPNLVQVGNSQGVRIPKSLIAQSGLADGDFDFELLTNGLLLKPQRQARAGWQQATAEQLATGNDAALDNDWQNAELTTDEDWVWE